MPSVAADYDPDDKALLDPSYAEWFKGKYNQRLHELALDAEKPAPEVLRVITPADGTTFFLDPEIPSGSDKLRPVTNLPGVARWESSTLTIDPAKPEPVIHLEAGTHVLTATDPRTGATRRITIHVKRL
jgi:penicillin-binding protein 1C